MNKFELNILDKSISTDILKKGFLLDKQGISNWLLSKQLLTSNADLLSFKDLTPWTRTGGETYSTTFSFKTNESTFILIAKAIVTTNPEKSLVDWTKRREILYKNGVPVSNWLWTGEATIIEPFYPNTFKSTKNFQNLIEIAFILDKLGFTTLKFLDDLRCDNNGNPFFIDFGFDLGEPSKKNCLNSKNYLINNFPNQIVQIETFYNEN
jgi:hypothetical protein